MEIDSYSSAQRPVSFPSGQTTVAKSPTNERRESNEPRQEPTIPAATQSDTEAEFNPAAPRGSLLDISV